MAYFAPTCPPHILEGFLNEGRLGPYHLLLTHDILAQPDYYKHLFVDQREQLFVCKILDNSLIELGSSMTAGDVAAAANIVKPHVVILPDAYLDMQLTIKQIRDQLVEWRALMPDVAFMYVPQGRSLLEWTMCAEALWEIGAQDAGSPLNERYKFWWGIPKNLTGEIGSRREAIEIARAINPSAPIHLLGFSDNFIDDVLCARHPEVVGIDSAVPIRIVNQGVKLSMAMTVPKRGSWWDEAVYDYEMFLNYDQVQRWINVRR